MDERALLNRVIKLVLSLADLPARERLEVLGMTWLTVANNARSEALAIPDGFPLERARQVEQLASMAALIGAHEPDLEWERLAQENDLAGMLRRLQQLADEVKLPGDEQAKKDTERDT